MQKNNERNPNSGKEEFIRVREKMKGQPAMTIEMTIKNFPECLYIFNIPDKYGRG